MIIKARLGGIACAIAFPKDVIGPLPLSVYLHGAGGGGEQFIGAMRNMNAVSVVPRCPSGDIWRPADIKAIVDEVVAGVDGLPKVDPNMTSILGHSMGGRGVWDTICDYPNLFAVAVPISGFACYLRAQRIARKVKVRAYHGMMDECVPPLEAIKMIDALRCRNSDAEMHGYLFEGHGIEGSVLSDEEFLSWMIGQTKEQVEA